ncbi:MAG: hypothetical protein ACXAD7_15340 [Candidatus Kariarchaeaceae archaeon]|jgi:hypothetical protein
MNLATMITKEVKMHWNKVMQLVFHELQIQGKVFQCFQKLNHDKVRLSFTCSETQTSYQIAISENFDSSKITKKIEQAVAA